ncbi:MAG: alpha/beta hydrolase [Neisseriaceae bacterium]|jgi:alpha/beta superfamily hydrolase
MSNTILIPRNAKQIFINGPSGKLDSLLLSPSNGEAIGAAVIFHPDPKGGGTYTNKVVQTMAKVLCQKGYLCICPNLRGVGLSEGVYDYGVGEIEDGQAVLNYLKVEYPDLPIVIGGFSFGAYIASKVAQNTQYKKLILIGPAAVNYNISISDINKTIAIHGENDEVVAPDAIKQWSRDNDLPVIWFPNTGHFFHGKLVVLQNLLNSFMF